MGEKNGIEEVAVKEDAKQTTKEVLKKEGGLKEDLEDEKVLSKESVKVKEEKDSKIGVDEVKKNSEGIVEVSDNLISDNVLNSSGLLKNGVLKHEAATASEVKGWLKTESGERVSLLEAENGLVGAADGQVGADHSEKLLYQEKL